MDTLNPPENFDFPFTPYPIQHDFMKELYSVLESKSYGIFESPTGTGKSLSIICGALRWLKDFKANQYECLQNQISTLELKKRELSSDSTDWITTQTEEIEITRQLNKLKLEHNKVIDYDKKIENLKSKRKKKIDRKVFIDKQKKSDCKKDGLDLDNLVETEVVDDDLILECDVPENEDQELSEEEDKEEKFVPIKIYICSRTHSQLTQFVGELQKSPFSDARVVSLSSRQNYCINPNVNKLKNVSLINERCLDMQKNLTKATAKDSDGKTTKRQKGSNNCKCPYYKQQNIDELKDTALLDIQDIEDLVKAGKELKACPYYASRKAVEDAEVVLVPYNTILHKATREANGISLKNNVIIVDEAHNLLEALAQMHSTEVSYDQLVHAHQQLKDYKTRYSKKFSAYNLLCINQLIYVTSRLKEELDKKVVSQLDSNKTQIFTIGSFVLNAEIDNFNMFKLVKFVKDSKISHKLHSFAIKFVNNLNEVIPEPQKGIKSFLASIENKAKTELPPPTPTNDKVKVKPIPTNPLLAVVAFLEALTYSYEDGRILVHRNEHKKMQFLVLNASSHFQDIIKEARSVIVAGGTMKPMSEFKDRLLINSGAPREKIIEFSCDHIIPKENILPIIVTCGPQNEKLLFNYENRFKMGNNLKLVLRKACQTVKGGIVIFFPSYKYENWIWEQVKNIQFGRPIFREPQESGSVDSVLDNYYKAIYKGDRKGALLFSVVGGKLSEGLNFSDDLGRCVIVVGLPYANIYALDLKEKMSYLDKIEGSNAGKRFYENMCMKSVNQCIGRAVRHQNDYATVLLLDERYDRPATKNALPGWIQRSLRTAGFTDGFKLVKEFFDNKT